MLMTKNQHYAQATLDAEWPTASSAHFVWLGQPLALPAWLRQRLKPRVEAVGMRDVVSVGLVRGRHETQLERRFGEHSPTQEARCRLQARSSSVPVGVCLTTLRFSCGRNARRSEFYGLLIASGNRLRNGVRQAPRPPAATAG